MSKNLGRIVKAAIVLALILAVVLSQFASAWTRSYHRTITTDAYTISTTFGNYITSNNLDDDLLYYVDHADDDSEKAWVAHLDGDDSYSPAYNVDIWEKVSDPDSVPHCRIPVEYNLEEDYRLHNAQALLDLALSFKSSNPTLAMRILSNGMHLLQDYFAHLNAPGTGTVSHGVDVMVDTNGNGVPDTYAGELVDNIMWDNHSDHGNDLVPFNLREADLFNASYWHEHANKESCWRYKAAKEMTIEYMQAYAVYEASTYFDNAIARGYVNNYDVNTYIDLLVHIVVDNDDAGFTKAGTWTLSSSLSDRHGANYYHDGTSGADSSSKYARWTPTIPISDNYDVYMWWADYTDRPDAAPVTVVYNGGTDTSKTVNEKTGGGQWHYIGTYHFTAGTSGYVQLDTTDAGYTEADAVMFVREMP